MKKKVISICLLVLLTIVSFGFIMNAQGVAGEGDWITQYKVEDPISGQLLLEANFKTGENRTVSSVFVGSEIKVTITLDLPVTSPDTILRLTTSLISPESRDSFWKLVTQEYQLWQYNPNEQTVQFYQVTGQLVLELYGKIPSSAVGNVAIPYTLVTLYGPTGETLDFIKVRVVTLEMAEYDNLLIQKEEKLQSLKTGGVALGYIELYENILDQSKVEASNGNVDGAIALLNALSVANEPVTSVSYMEVLFLPAVGILAALTVVFGLMFIRGRGKVGYMLQVLEDQIRDLEGLTLRASKIDRTISASLESVKDRLRDIVGV
jgi:hypothetical protein